ncbi:SOS response-associated peptidase family protein [Thioalkalicoccus limnaeus]|uniref:Abasic site processing protein n=1 Tax=Thioalkalicoccus limnaeus TaxID=120681 RepID=A0ABV4BJ12_9GAMM
MTDSNRFLAPIHNRMPVLLDPEDFATWLDPENQDKDVLKGLLRSYPGERLQAVPVSRRVNNPKNDDPGLVEQVGEPAG